MREATEKLLVTNVFCIQSNFRHKQTELSKIKNKRVWVD